MASIGHSLGENAKITKVQATAASAGTAVNSSSVNMAGFEGVIFCASIGTANTGNFITAQQSSDDGSSDSFTDIAGTKVASDGTSTDLLVEVYQPREQYVRCHVDRSGTNTTVEAIWAIQFNPRKGKVDNTSPAAQEFETHLSPAEGTA